VAAEEEAVEASPEAEEATASDMALNDSLTAAVFCASVFLFTHDSHRVFNDVSGFLAPFEERHVDTSHFEFEFGDLIFRPLPIVLKP